MEIDFGLYQTPDSMEPMIPSDESMVLEQMAIGIIGKSARLSGVLNPITRAAISDFVRTMNSYYAHLLEGHEIHPADIASALKNAFSDDTATCQGQMEALAYVQLHQSIMSGLGQYPAANSPYSTEFLRAIHENLYERLPHSSQKATADNGQKGEFIPGDYRQQEVRVGGHMGPDSTKLELFMDSWEAAYTPEQPANKSKIRRIMHMAAAHHRFVWIHPFTEGNGRVAGLFSDACFTYEGLDASGLWSMSRGLALTQTTYTTHLANADLRRLHDKDGQGNLSNKMLVDFCAYFLQTAMDQVDHMVQLLDVSAMCSRIENWADWMVLRHQIRPQAKYILTHVFLKGNISKTEALQLTGTSDKTLKLIVQPLYDMGLLQYAREGKEAIYYAQYPISCAPFLFPGLYPKDKEVVMMGSLQEKHMGN
jgi:Fic family protein